MSERLQLKSIWQVWNVTCDGSIIVGNGHRNMGFFRRPIGRKAKTLMHLLKATKPAFSLGEEEAKVVLDSDLRQDPVGFHVFDYMQLNDANIDIKTYLGVIDLRLGSFVIFAGNIFTAERIADELDTYPGRPFLARYLKGAIPAPVEPSDVFEILVPSDEDVKHELLQDAKESLDGDYEQWEPNELEKQIEDYIDTYCYPDLDLKIPDTCCSTK